MLKQRLAKQGQHRNFSRQTMTQQQRADLIISQVHNRADADAIF